MTRNPPGPHPQGSIAVINTGLIGRAPCGRGR